VHLALNDLACVEARNIGVSDTEGRLRLSIPHVNSGEATFGATRYEGVEMVETPVHRLDDIAGPARVHFLKIDVEGYEVHVLRGATALLERDRPFILTEVVERHLESAGETRRSLSDLLEARGYRSYRLGLAGRGARQRLCLEEGSASARDGDFLWVPADKVHRVTGFVRAPGISAHKTERAPG
jgi:hypothetical protein